MYLENQEPEFNAFLAENTSFWREHTGFPGGADANIYVDLAHDNPAYLLTNLWIAKYLQRLRPARLIGLASEWPGACPHYSFNAVKKLADSFLVDQIINLDEMVSDDEDMVASFVQRTNGATGPELRRLVLEFGQDIDPDLGWVLYDTWLRQERHATFHEVTTDLIKCATRVCKARRATIEAMTGHNVIGAVVGHYHYSPYAWIAREAAKRKAPVLFQSLLLPISIRRFASEPDFRRGRPSDFLSGYEALIAANVSRATLDSFERRMFETQSGIRQFFRVISPTKQLKSRDSILGELNLDHKKATVCFFVPALSGPPHCFGEIPFDDNGDWLEKSLTIAAETPSVNFVVKAHPQDQFYDVTNLVERCKAAHASRTNIKFLPPDMPLDLVASICDVAVTISGTPGYEMAARGIPTISAGPSRYSGLGFSNEPRTYAEYKALLQSPHELELDMGQRQRAILYFFFELAAARSQTLFVPTVRTASLPSFWQEATHNLRSKRPEEDPLFRNLSHMIAHDLPFLLNTDLIVTEGGHPTIARPPVEQLLAGLHSANLAVTRLLETRIDLAKQDSARTQTEGEIILKSISSWIDEGHEVRVGRGQMGSIFLRYGWSVPEDGGIWTDGTPVTVSFPSSCTYAVLCLECLPYAPEKSHSCVVTAWQDGTKVSEGKFGRDRTTVWRVPVRSRAGRIDLTLRINQLHVPPGGTRQLGIWLSRFWLDREQNMPREE